MEINKNRESKLERVKESSVRQQMLRNVISSDGAGIAPVFLSVSLGKSSSTLCTDVVFFFFLFFSIIGERVTLHDSLALAVNKSPAVFIFSLEA